MRPPFPLLHAAVGRAGDEECAVGVGHDQIAGAVELHHFIEAGLHLFLTGNVHADGDGGESLPGQFSGQRFGGGQIHVGHGNAVTLLCHALGAGLADAGSGAGDECSFQNHIVPSNSNKCPAAALLRSEPRGSRN